MARRNAHALVINTADLRHWVLALPENDDNGSFWWTPDSAHIVVPVGQDKAAIYGLHGHMLKMLYLGIYAAPIDSAFGLLLYFCPAAVSRPPLTAGCVMNIWTGKVMARVPHLWSSGSGSQQIGLFDASHVYGWSGNRIVVRDFHGNLVRVMAIDDRHDRNNPPMLYFSHSP
jgi:hypothetical protein